jgi:hypothetical protein
LGAPFTGHSAMGMLDKSFNGWLEGWSARGLARGTTSGQHKASQAAPGTALQISLDARFAATCFCSLPGHQFWPGRPSQPHGNWFVWWPRLSEDTGAGGLTPSVLVWHPPSGPIASGDGVNALNSWAISFGPGEQEDGTGQGLLSLDTRPWDHIQNGG